MNESCATMEEQELDAHCCPVGLSSVTVLSPGLHLLLDFDKNHNIQNQMTAFRKKKTFKLFIPDIKG